MTSSAVLSVTVIRLAPWSLARVLAAVGLALGTVGGVLLAALVPLAAASPYGGEVHEIAGGLVTACLVFGPVGGALVGLVGGALGALVYNAVARIVGGVRVDVRRPPFDSAEHGPPETFPAARDAA